MAVRHGVCVTYTKTGMKRFLNSVQETKSVEDCNEEKGFNVVARIQDGSNEQNYGEEHSFVI